MIYTYTHLYNNMPQTMKTIKGELEIVYNILNIIMQAIEVKKNSAAIKEEFG